MFRRFNIKLFVYFKFSVMFMGLNTRLNFLSISAKRNTKHYRILLLSKPPHLSLFK